MRHFKYPENLIYIFALKNLNSPNLLATLKCIDQQFSKNFVNIFHTSKAMRIQKRNLFVEIYNKRFMIKCR